MLLLTLTYWYTKLPVHHVTCCPAVLGNHQILSHFLVIVNSGRVVDSGSGRVVDSGDSRVVDSGGSRVVDSVDIASVIRANIIILCAIIIVSISSTVLIVNT